MMSLPSPALSRRSGGDNSSHVTYSPLNSPGIGRRKPLAGRLLPHKKRVFPIDSGELDRPDSPIGSEFGGLASIRDKRIRDLFRASDIRCHSAPNSPRVSYCSAGAGKQQQQQQQQQQQRKQCAQSLVDAASIRRQRNASMCSAGALQLQPPPPPPYPGSCRSLLVGCGAASTVAGSRTSLLSCQSTLSYACRVQEVRELSLGRHNREPFGMKVEFVGGSFFITHVVAGSAAAYAGLKSGDEIVGINGRQLEGLQTREVLQIIRHCEVSVRLAYRPRAVVARIREVRLMKDNGVVGLRLQKKPDGLYIDFVKQGTPAHAAGLKQGDQVLKVNGHFVTEWSMEGAMALLKSLNEELVLLVRETLPLVAPAQAPGRAANLRSSQSTLASAPAYSRRTPDGGGSCCATKIAGDCSTKDSTISGATQLPSKLPADLALGSAAS